MAYRYDGFWQCMDTIRDKKRLQKIWDSGEAPWKTWADEEIIEPTPPQPLQTGQNGTPA
jgi:glucose-1-phosphate cytidylyltransferase